MRHTLPKGKGKLVEVSCDEHPGETSFGAVTKLKGIVRAGSTVTPGNASGKALCWPCSTFDSQPVEAPRAIQREPAKETIDDV